MSTTKMTRNKMSQPLCKGGRKLCAMLRTRLPGHRISLLKTLRETASSYAALDKKKLTNYDNFWNILRKLNSQQSLRSVK
ncbi:Protein of unknown function [Gryllus bimaculatus]|nr:Protein of unknown function [Gryllus bimaculatus]